MTLAVLGKGAQLGLGDGASPQVYTTIAEVLRVGPIGSTNPEVDVTNLDSTAREYIAGLPDGLNVEFEMNFVVGNAQQQSLRSSQEAGSTVALRLLWDTSPQASAEFNFVLLDFQMGETTPDAQTTARIAGRISGSIQWTNA